MPEDEIVWHSNHKLKWTDFKGRPERSQPYEAISFCSIESKVSQLNNEAEFEMIAKFDKTKSWTKTDTSAHILNHEQRHFDITEIYTRKIRKAISDKPLTMNDYYEQFKEIHTKYLREVDSCQNSYDLETNHSKNKLQQKLWDRKIEMQLDSLKNYSGHRIKKELQ